MVLKMLHISVVDPYHFDADPGSENVHYGSGSRPNVYTDSNPGKNDRYRSGSRQIRIQYQENL